MPISWEISELEDGLRVVTTPVATAQSSDRIDRSASEAYTYGISAPRTEALWANWRSSSCWPYWRYWQRQRCWARPAGAARAKRPLRGTLMPGAVTATAGWATAPPPTAIRLCR